jgi:hypothetical protein
MYHITGYMYASTGCAFASFGELSMLIVEPNEVKQKLPRDIPQCKLSWTVCSDLFVTFQQIACCKYVPTTCTKTSMDLGTRCFVLSRQERLSEASSHHARTAYQVVIWGRCLEHHPNALCPKELGPTNKSPGRVVH